MDALGIERAHVVGNSMGGRVAIELGLRAPDRVGGLALLCPAVAFVRRELAPARARRCAPSSACSRTRSGRGRIEAQFWSLFADRDLVDPTVADIVVDEFERIYRSRGARLAFLTSARTIYLEKPVRPRRLLPAAGRSSQPPALFVWSSHDKLIPPGVPPPRRALAARAPSRSCSTAAATCRRSSARSAPTGCSSASSPASTRSARARGLERGVSTPTSTNGHGTRRRRAALAARSSRRGGARRGLRWRRGRLAARRASRLVAGRIPAADLDERDPDYIRETPARGCGCSRSLYFRGEVRGLGNVPEEGRVLLVGNHSGGNLTPDTTVFTLAFSTYFGVERAFHQLAHNLVLSFPGLSFLRKYGTVAASHENARTALESGAAVLVYPGGDYEVHRPSWERHRVDFGGRKGFIRLALEQDVPIVPVVAVGGQETALFLSRGESPGAACSASTGCCA